MNRFFHLFILFCLNIIPFYGQTTTVSGNIKDEKKENLAFRLIQLLKSDSRSDLLVEISHAYLASKNEKPRLPKNFSGDILYADKLELHFYIMNTIEGLLETKGGEK